MLNQSETLAQKSRFYFFILIRKTISKFNIDVVVNQNRKKLDLVKHNKMSQL